MQLLVQKYGGTSVGTLERIGNVAVHIKNTREQSPLKLIVVVSAMGTYTDELIQMGRALHPWPPRRELDMLLSAGERISASLLSIALHRQGIAAISLTGSQSGILTDSVHGNARISKILGHRIREELKTHDVVIIAGFQGVSPLTKDVTTLGRGGSDLTAVALAIALEAKGCEIYTDVPGIMTADPRQVSNARVLHTLSWEMMSELASAGAGVVHHRAALVAQKFQMPFEIRSSQNFSLRGTFIEGHTMESPQVIAVTSKSDQSLIRFLVQPEDIGSRIMHEGLEWLWKNEHSPTIYRSFQAGHSLAIETVIDSSLVSPFLDFVESLVTSQQGALSRQSAEASLCIVTLVGLGFRHAPHIVQKVLGLFVQMPKVFEVKDNAIVMSVTDEQSTDFINTLHDVFFPKDAKSSEELID